MKMKAAEVIMSFLKKRGIDKIFIYPGGTIAPLIDAAYKKGIELICARNEQGAGYAAIGAAKVSGKPQVVMVTSGPGATNILTPTADAFYDSVPLIVFTGQVATKYVNFDKKLRQTGFQETDTVNIFSPITKKATILLQGKDVVNVLNNLYALSESNRPGPVLLDLPMDIQNETIKSNYDFEIVLSENQKLSDEYEINEDDLHKTLDLLKSAKRPLILVGNGVYISNSVLKFRELVYRVGIPVVSSLPAVGALSSNCKLFFGFIGHTGEFYSNLALYYSDVLLVLGSRLDIRQIGTEIQDFNKKTIIRVDIDENELLYSKVKSTLSFKMDLNKFFNAVLPLIPSNKEFNNNIATWVMLLKNFKEQYSSDKFYSSKDSLFMKDVIEKVSETVKDRKVVVSSGVGGHQQMVARYFKFDYPNKKWISSCGHGTMGFDLPSIIGALIEDNDADFGIVFVGDGSFQMNIQELASIIEYKLPVKIFVLDDKRLGIVSQFQILNWGKDPTTGNKKNPSFSKIAKAYGLKSYDIYSKKDLKIINNVFSDYEPTLVHCHITYGEDVLPMLLSGQKLNEMYPFGKVEVDYKELSERKQ